MILLLDTCTLLWLEMNHSRVPAGLLRILAKAETRRFLSAAVPWEISIKWSTGKLALPFPPEEFVKRARMESILETMPIFESAAFQSGKLPLLHKDPFDRIQISQAIEMGIPIVTPDPLIRQYAVRTIWD